MNSSIQLVFFFIILHSPFLGHTQQQNEIIKGPRSNAYLAEEYAHTATGSGFVFGETRISTLENLNRLLLKILKLKSDERRLKYLLIPI